MGKLSDLWGDLKAESDPDKIKDIQKQINGLEQWCITKGFAGIKEITDWTKSKSKKTYRFESVKDGGLLIPDGAMLGKDKCWACTFNKHSYCGRNIQGGKPCLVNI
jgi:hypothetical protein